MRTTPRPFLVMLHHDSRKAEILVNAVGKDAAILLVKLSEECPESAIQNVFELRPIETLSKDEYFMLKPTNKVCENNIYCFDKIYDRSSKKYSAHKFSDVNDYKYLKKGTLVFTDFEF